MKSRRISWFWPFSFLAALGQVLLLITQNEGGPAEARFALALWTLWIPGVWLGNLLTKPRTGLLARLPLQASCALAVNYLFLQLQIVGILPRVHLPLVLSALSTIIAGVFLFLPEGPPDRRQTRFDVKNYRPADPAVLSMFGVLIVVLMGLQLWAGSPLGLRPDAVNHVAAATRSAEIDFPLGAYAEDLGTEVHDTHRGLAPAWLNLTSVMSSQPPHVLWDLLPVLAAPLLLLAFFAFARVIFPNELLAVAGTLAYLIWVSSGLSNDVFRTAGYPDRMALIPFWISLGLFIEGLDRPHPRIGVALTLTALATVGTHLGAGWLLALGMLTVGTFTWTSVDRFLEGIPLLMVLWLPALAVSGAYLLLRAATIGSIDPAVVPAQGLLILDPGMWILDPGRYSRPVLAAAIASVLFLPVLFRDAWSRITSYALVSLTVLTLMLGFNPWLFPSVERSAGSWVHMLPSLAPVPLVLVALTRWALIGLARSQRFVWVRFVIVGMMIALTATVCIDGLRSPKYLARSLAESPDDPSRWSAAADSLATVAPHPGTVVAPPATASALAALSRLRSALEPLSTNTPAEAFARWSTVHSVVGLHGEHVPDTLAVLDLMRELAANVALLQNEPDTMAFHTAPARTHPAPGIRVIAVAAAGETWLAEDPLLPLILGTPPPAPVRIPIIGGPELIDLTPDVREVSSGGRLNLRARWEPRIPGDPAAYRVRIEVVRMRNEGELPGQMRRALDYLRTAVIGTRSGFVLEVPWDPDPEGFQDFTIAVPGTLSPAWFNIRVGLLRGETYWNRLRDGLEVLPATTHAVPVRVISPDDLLP